MSALELTPPEILTPPAPVTPVAPEQAHSLVKLEPETVNSLNARVKEFVSAIMTLQPHSEEFKTKAASIHNLGRQAEGPPPIENRQVECAVDHRFHAAGTTGFQRTAWRVQPHVHALHELPGYIDVVVFQEYNFPDKPRVSRSGEDPLNELLALFVGRMGFPGIDNLNRHVQVIDQSVESIQISQQEIHPFVWGEAPGDAYRQRGGV